MRIDCHQHFWLIERGDYDWLTTDLAPLYRNFLPQHLEGLLAQAGVDKTILVQAAATVAESQYLLSLADEYDFIAGVVGWIDMEGPQAIAQMAQLAEHSALKGIRPMIQDIADVDWILQKAFSPIFEQLVARDLCLDALVKPIHLSNLRTLLGKHPDLKVVINHAAKPDIASGNFDDWAEDIAVIAATTNAYCKLSGLLTEGAVGAGTVELTPYVDHLLKHFGPIRLMWGSDWPVLNLAAGYADWVTITETLLDDLGSADRDTILGGTAAHFYGLSE